MFQHRHVFVALPSSLHKSEAQNVAKEANDKVNINHFTKVFMF